MIQNASFRRKVIYMGLIALLLIPLYTIGNPATGDPTEANSTPGGKLAQLRAEYDLSPAELGEIDPASVSMKLLLLGMPGIASNIAWTKANQYKKKENWEGLVAVVEQLARLQPHYISVWEYQSHNLSYNVSVEHDDYRFRYLWVKKGIDFMIKGTRYNRREPKMFWTVGWFTGQKFGRSDERRQFRPLFADDTEFHKALQVHVPVDPEGRGPSGKPDSWLVSKLWFDAAYRVISTEGVPLRGKAPHVFYADGPKAQMNHASAIEEEGYFDEQAEDAWRLAGDLWEALGRRPVLTSWGQIIRLADEEAKLAEAKRLTEELDREAVGARQEIREEKFASLTQAQQDALNSGEMTVDNYMDYQMGSYKTLVSHREVAERARPENRAQAFRLADAAAAAALTADRIDRYRTNINYEYWRTRCEVEQLPDAVAARRHAFEANRLLDEVLIDDAKKEFEAAWDRWASIFNTYPVLVQQVMAEDLHDDYSRYKELLGQLEEEVPEDFPLPKIRELIEAEDERVEAAPMISEGSQP